MGEWIDGKAKPAGGGGGGHAFALDLGMLQTQKVCLLGYV